MKVDIIEIIDHYKKSKSIWKTGKHFAVTGQKVHKILNENGVDTSRKGEWSAQELADLKLLYEEGFKCGDGKLDAFCEKYNRFKSTVSRKAKKLNLSNPKRYHSETSIKRISVNAKKRIKKNGHPKGMKGKSHSEKTKKRLSDSSIEMWKNPDFILNSKEHRQKLSDRASKSMEERLKNNPSSVYSKSKKGTITIGGYAFFARSSWEANIGAYLEFLKQNKEIKKWEHEPKTFWFLKIKRGVRSYKPDFFVTRNNNSTYYIEVKGWMDKKSATKLKRMKKYYPDIELQLIDSKIYNSIKKNSAFIPHWGLLDVNKQMLPENRCSLDGCKNKYYSKNFCRKHFYKVYGK